MNATLEQVREALQKDDLPYVNDAITQYMAAAKSTLYIQIGYRTDKVIAEADEREFETLSNLYIVEFVRSFLDGINNKVTLDSLITQLYPLYNHGRQVNDGNGS